MPPHVALGPTLETERLILRPPAVEDFPRWAGFMADPETARFIGGVQPAPQVWRLICTVAGMWALTGEGMFSILEKETGQWIGRIGPLHPYGWPGREVGWSLHRDATGKGYAVEAAAATMDYAFDVLGWDDVIHCIAPENLPSAAVATRLGSRNRGPGALPEPLQDIAIDLWGQTRDEWAINRTRLKR
nr:GNAT family N-acetyltransferase [Brevundimonas sp. SPF441]